MRVTSELVGSHAASGATEERSELAGAVSVRGPGIPARSERDQKIRRGGAPPLPSGQGRG